MHTPGPWKASGDEIVGGMWFHKIETVDQQIHEGEHPCPVALCYGIDTHVFEHLGSSEENALLIAAAPDLLAALEKIRPFVDLDYKTHDGIRVGAIIDNAISKATGAANVR